MDRHGGKLMDADSIKISVIVPVYQVESYLKKCVDSILAQTHRNLEIFLVDDGSPDGCGSICEEYARRDGRVTVVHKSNGGLSDARNAGLERTNGDYIGFVDSDDWVENDMLEALLDLCLSRNAGIAVCEKYIVENDRVVAPPYSPGEEPVTARGSDGGADERPADRQPCVEQAVPPGTVRRHPFPCRKSIRGRFCDAPSVRPGRPDRFFAGAQILLPDPGRLHRQCDDLPGPSGSLRSRRYAVSVPPRPVPYGIPPDGPGLSVQFLSGL